jgi:hypothetical protein
MIYPELAAIDATPDQDLGLTIAFKLAANQQQTAATTPGEYLAERVMQLLGDYASHHVVTEQKARIDQALATATDKEKQDIATILKVDLVVVPPDALKP